MMNTISSTRNSNRGFSLVEALVALVVLSIGMLGIAALYVESLRAGKSALMRTQAVMMAAEMADRIRANPTVPASYVKTIDATGTITASCNPGGTGCSAAEMAANDIERWREMVDDRADDPATGRVALPGGRGIISVVGTASPAEYTITVSWSESGQTTTNTYVLRFEA